jgi:hypothetical protein
VEALKYESQIEEEKMAERFDFTMNKCMHKFGMKVDEMGERIFSVHAATSRAVSSDCMVHEPT